MWKVHNSTSEGRVMSSARSHSRTRKRDKARRRHRREQTIEAPPLSGEALARDLVRRGLRSDVILDRRGIPNNKPDRANRPG